jgi:MFS family permease
MRRSDAWRQLDESQRVLTPHSKQRAWLQLLLGWLLFVQSAGVYHSPATLLGAHCNGRNRTAIVVCSLAEEFGEATPAMIGWLPSTFLLTKGLLALPAGAALQRFGGRMCILAGTALLLVSTALYCFVSAFWQLPLVYAVFGMAYCLSGLTPLIVHTNSWFGEASKASSIGLLVTGYSTAGVLWPSAVAALADAHGWRVAAAMLPVATLCIALPIAACLLRDGPVGRATTPRAFGQADATATSSSSSSVAVLSTTTPCSSSMGGGVVDLQRRDGMELGHFGPAVAPPPPPPPPSAGSDVNGARGTSDPRSWYTSDAELGRAQQQPPDWRTDPVVWLLGGMSALTLYMINAVQHWLVAFLTSPEVGLTLTSAGMYTSGLFALSIAGKVVGGALLDRPPRQRRLAALTGCMLLAIGGALTLTPTRSQAGQLSRGEEEGGAGRGGGGGGGSFGFELTPASEPTQLIAFVSTFGLGYGVAFTLVQSRAAQLYGGRSDFARLQSALAVPQYLGSFLGVLLTSSLRDAETHSFARPFALLPLIGLLNCILCVRVFASGRAEGSGEQTPRDIRP